MRDPTRRSEGSWPRDRPIRWRGVAGNLTWLVVASVAAIIQFGLVVPILIVGGSPAGDALGGSVGIGLALLWGGLTLFAAWSWILGRWRVVIAPLATGAALIVAASVFGS